jgi:hypothetical protein
MMLAKYLVASIRLSKGLKLESEKWWILEEMGIRESGEKSDFEQLFRFRVTFSFSSNFCSFFLTFTRIQTN